MAALRARTHFSVGRRFVRPGDILDSTDPIVAGREHLFSPIGDAGQPVEQATARPGEGRNVRPPSSAAGAGAGDGGPGPERPDEKKGNATAWRAYAEHLGIPVEVDGKAKTKKQLIADVAEHEAAQSDAAGDQGDGDEVDGDPQPPADDDES